ncbi:AGBL5 family protein [Megaselia abdita]
MQPVMRFGNCGRWERVKDKPQFQTEDGNFVMSFCHHVPETPQLDISYAFTYPFSYTECQTMLEKFDEKFSRSEENLKEMISQVILARTSDNLKITDEHNVGDTRSSIDILDEIYYKRELLINSLEGRRVDLLTITSFQGILNKKEDRLGNLFLDDHPNASRCHRFENKKMIFLSSRVHPGETPASFILNGFLNMILDRKNPIAIALRQLYVFKIVPIINPDGVYRGFYRTDTLGQNLNRWYTQPTLLAQPTIYAIKKIIYYYTTGIDLDETLESKTQKNCPTLPTNSDSENDNASLSSTSSEDRIRPSTSTTKSESPSTSTTLEETLPNNNNNRLENSDSTIPMSETSTSDESENNGNNPKKFVQEQEENKAPIALPAPTPIPPPPPPPPPPKKQKPFVPDKNMSYHTILASSKKGTKKRAPLSSSLSKKFGTPTIPRRYLFETNLDVTYEFARKMSTTNVNEVYKMFLYIDFHGHASKKGVFMYGNHFSNVSEAVECKLLPKLMSINSQHFHFDACNFSEKNMYKREKRDGMSKEGSGRVDIFKMAGLIKSYTLEGNYNTGRYINILPPIGSNTQKKITTISTPPKYNPNSFEEVGKALGTSILDMTNSNTLSRLQNSEYRTLQGLRISLRNDIERANNPRHQFGRTTQINYQPNKRLKRPTSSATTTTPTVSNTQITQNTSSSSASTSASSYASAKAYKPAKKLSFKAKPTSVLFPKNKTKQVLVVDSSSSNVRKTPAGPSGVNFIDVLVPTTSDGRVSTQLVKKSTSNSSKEFSKMIKKKRAIRHDNITAKRKIKLRTAN